jgi:hypothetical protein
MGSQAKQKLDILLAQQELLRKLMAETTLKEVTVTTRIKTKLEQVNEKYASGFFSGNGAKRSYAFDLVNAESRAIMHKPERTGIPAEQGAGFTFSCAAAC